MLFIRRLTLASACSVIPAPFYGYSHFMGEPVTDFAYVPMNSTG